MNRFLVWSLLATLFWAPVYSPAQEVSELPSGYYMTVAAYLTTGEGYAQRYAEKLRTQGYAEAGYGFSYKKNMYFVYIRRYDDRQAAIRDIAPTRQNTPFADAWVYVYQATRQASSPPEEGQPEEEKTATEAPLREPDDATGEQPRDREKEEIVTETEKEIMPGPESRADSMVAEKEPVPQAPAHPPGSRLVLIDAAHARTGEPVEAEFTLYDPFDEQVLATVKAGEAQWVRPPANEQKIVRISTNTFGWKKDEVGISFANPVTDSTEYFASLHGDTLVLYFEMHRLRKGDIQTLYNVYFFNQSSIMRPESRAQLNELLAMLRENPHYRIMLHGHTNGTASGNYVRLAEGDTLFFKMSRIHERTSGSAKALSYDRAQTVRQYLIQQGIAPDRIEVKGWGGKRMIYDENSPAARRNIRVEVEVLADE